MALNCPSADYLCVLNIFLGSHPLADHCQPATCIVTSAAEEDVEDSIATPSVHFQNVFPSDKDGRY
jgi:hypothetical protein